MELFNKVVVVTGASSGIGAATASAMAERGARTILLARRRPALEAVAGVIQSSGGRADVYDVDLTDGQAVVRTAERIAREIGVPDVIVNNAGAGRYLSIDETDPREAVEMMAAPYFAAFFVTRAFIKNMLERASGHIVNVTSPASRTVWPGANAYCAARWAMEGFNWALRADLRGTGIGVTLVVAGKTASPYFRHNPGSEQRIPSIARILPTVSTERVAAALLAAVERDRPVAFVPPALRGLLAANRVSPRTVRWVMARSGWRRSGRALGQAD